MSDRELLEMAAKASGIEFVWKNCRYMTGPADMYGVRAIRDELTPFLSCGLFWNPLIDDGDAMRLAVKLRLSMELYCGEAVIYFDDTTGGDGRLVQDDGDDVGMSDTELTRRAIVRAAAEIGAAISSPENPS